MEKILLDVLETGAMLKSGLDLNALGERKDVGLRRNQGEPDDTYRKRLLVRIRELRLKYR
ncbi:MAG: hypothetical protein OSB38_32435 [Paraburkholderia fungorum]|nr:hypothetical protein [Paraburkholderia fungorum]